MTEAAEIVTTGSWYYRLHRAVHDDRSTGALSAAAQQLSVATRSELLVLLDDLPAEILVPGPRILVPIMG